LAGSATSSSRNGRRIKRVEMPLRRAALQLNTNRARVSIHNRDMQTKTGEGWRPAPVPGTSSLTQVREAARDCTACHLYKRATQTVFGEGPKGAPIMLVGEQPGDYEDVAGKPFVGPAGKIMDRALEEAGIDRGEAFQMGAARQKTHSPETELARNRRLPSVVGSGAATR